MSGNYLEWTRDDPHLQGHALPVSAYSFTGWYYQSSARTWTNIFRSGNIPGNCCDVGQRVLGLFQNADPGPFFSYSADLDNLANNNCQLNIAVRLTQAIPFIGNWVYIGMSVRPGQMNFCYAIWPNSPVCSSSPPMIAGNFLQWGTTSAATISIGDVYHGGVVGKIADQRYYLNSALTTADMTAKYTARKLYCGENCLSCALPFECSGCSLGNYLNSASQCQPCNACCLGCSGAGNSACIQCYSACVLTAGACIRKMYSGCAAECASCDGRRHWNCLTCSPGYSLQPQGSHLCLATCPTGYVAVGGVCQGSDQTVFSLQLDTITPTVKSVNGVEALNGQTSAYYPPIFEASDPRPSQHRGYYFSGTQYMQLPPDSIGVPLMLPTSLTFGIWLRPLGDGVIYHKNNIMKLAINGNKVEITTGSPMITYTHTTSLSMNIWTYLGVTVSFSSVTGLSSITVHLDGSQAGTVYTSETFIKDESSTATQLIGTDLTNFYTGFIWKVVICNYVSSIVTTDFGGLRQPLGLSFQLSPCAFLETINCVACVGCTNGCIRLTDCSLCLNPLCELCSDFTSCDQCVTNASGLAACQCDSGYFFGVNSRICDPCSSICKTCSGSTANSCLSCQSTAQLAGTTCTCATEYYMVQTTGQCSPCQIPCLACSDSSTCLSCQANAQISGSTCLCLAGFLPDPHPGNCSPCSSICKTCFGFSQNNCLSCHSTALLTSTTCTCSDGYYMQESTSQCAPCQIPCLACSASSICLSCLSNSHSHLENGTCLCDQGYRGVPPTCKACGEHCAQCESFCIECFAGYFNLGGECFAHCPKGYIEDSGLCIYEQSRNNPLTANLTFLYNETFQLSFSSSLSRGLRESDFTLSVTTQNSTNLTFSYNLALRTAFFEYRLELNISASCLEARVNMTLFPSNLTDIYSNPLETKELHQVVALPCPAKAPQTSMPPTVNPAAAAAGKGSIVGGAVNSVISGNPTSFYTIINNLQLLAYLPLSTIPIPQAIRSLLASLNMQSFISNPFMYWLRNDEGPEVPDFAASYGYESCLFLANCGVMICVGVLVMVYCGVVKVLARLPMGLLSFYLKEQTKGNQLLRYWLQVYMDVTLAAMLQVSKLSFATFNTGLNSCLGLLALTLSALTPFAIAFISLNCSAGADWKVLFEEFSCNSTRGSLFYTVFLFRRLVYSLSLIFAHASPKFQGTVFTAISLTVSAT